MLAFEYSGTIGPLLTCKEFLLDGDGIGADVLDCIRVRTVLEVAEE